jgi:hypothetical protein
MIVVRYALPRVNRLWLRTPVAQVGFLHHILGIHRATEHAVGDGKQIRPIGLKGFHHAPSRMHQAPVTTSSQKLRIASATAAAS